MRSILALLALATVACGAVGAPLRATDGGDDGGADSGDDSGMPCTPGCLSMVNIYFYDACCIEYDQNGKIIKDEPVQAAVCTSPDAQNNLCYSWDDTSNSQIGGTWGSNCPTGGPDPCYPYEM